MAKYIVFKTDSKTNQDKFLITTQEKVNNKFVKQWSDSIHDAHIFVVLESAQWFAKNKNANVASEIQFPELQRGVKNLSVNISVDTTQLKHGLNEMKRVVDVKHTEEYWQNRINDNLKTELEKESEKLIVKHAKKVFAWIKSRFGKKEGK